MNEPIALWGMSISDIISIVPALIAIYAVVIAWKTQPARLMVRRRYAALKPVGISRRESKKRVGDLVKGASHGPADELNWLARSYPVQSASSESGSQLPLPTTFALSAAELLRLSGAYASYAADLRRGSFLGTTSTPVVERETATATATSTVLSEAAAGEPFAKRSELNGLRVDSPALDRQLDFLQFPDAESGTLAFYTFVSYRKHRVSPSSSADGDAPEDSPGVDLTGLEHKDMDCSQEERQLLREKLASQHTFDGVLPRLVGWRGERSGDNGRLRLHLALAETTYGAVILDHYPAALGEEIRDVDGSRAQLLTLSSLLITSERELLFASRSRHAGSHQSQFGPAVNGNLELRPRKGVLSDFDAFGLPDPRLALAREAVEELGLILEPERFQTLGLGRFSVGTRERGTTVLLNVAQTHMTAAELGEQVRDADPMEGRWELGGELMTARLPKPGEDVEPMLSWLLHDTRLTPHAVLNGVAVLARFFPIQGEQIRRLARDPRDPSFSTTIMTLDG